MSRHRLGRAVVAATLLALAACGGEEGGDPTAFCGALRGATAVNAPVQSLALDDPASVDAARASLQALIDEAPAPIADDVEIVMGTYRDLIDAMASSARTARDDVLQEFQPRFTDALEPVRRVNDYARTTCGIALVGAEDSADTTSPTPSTGTGDSGREG